MSLLLQALQKAAKNREANQQPPEAITGFATTSGSTLELEPGEIEPPTPRAREFDLPAESPAVVRPAREEIPEPSPQQAAIVVGAAAAAKEPGFSIVDWARDHPVHIFAILSGIFLAFYFVYILVEVNYPGFWSRSLMGSSSSNGPIVRNTAQQRAPDPGPAPPQAAAPMPDLVPPLPLDQTAGGSPVSKAAAPSSAGPSVPPPAPGPEAKPTVAAAGSATTVAGTAVTSAPKAAVADTTSPKSGRIVRSDGVIDQAARPKQRAVAPVETGANRLTVRTTDDGASIQVALGEGYQLLQKGQLAEARQVYEGVLAADTRNIDALLGLASVAWQQGQTEKAAEHFYRVLQLDPQNAHAQSGLIGLMGRIDPTASETRLKQLIAREPSGGLYFTLGNLYAGERQWAPAQQAYFQALQLEPTNPDYAFNVAVGLEHLGQSKLALGYYRKALDLSFARGHAGFDQKQVIARIGELSAASE